MTARESKFHESEKTAEKTEAGTIAGAGPEFERTTKIELRFGLKRGTLYNLLHDGKIRGVTLPVRGLKSGVRLWDVESIRSYIKSEMNRSAKELRRRAPSISVSDSARIDGTQLKEKKAAKKENEAGTENPPVSPTTNDEKLIEQAVELIRKEGKASVSLLQRRLRLSYQRAGRVIDELEHRKIVGPRNGNEPRDIVVARKETARPKAPVQLSHEEINQLTEEERKSYIWFREMMFDEGTWRRPKAWFEGFEDSSDSGESD